MPRLVGKQSNNGLITSLLILVAIAAAVGLEYTGAVDVIPGFGRDTNSLRNNPRNVSEQSAVYKSVQQ
jgi:hypothetical protein